MLNKLNKNYGIKAVLEPGSWDRPVSGTKFKVTEGGYNCILSDIPEAYVRLAKGSGSDKKENARATTEALINKVADFSKGDVVAFNDMGQNTPYRDTELGEVVKEFIDECYETLAYTIRRAAQDVLTEIQTMDNQSPESLEEDLRRVKNEIKKATAYLNSLTKYNR